MSRIEAASKLVDRRSFSSMRGLREGAISAVVGPVFAYRAAQTGDWAGFAWMAAVGAIGLGWTGLGLVRMGRDQATHASSSRPPIAPPPIPFSDDPVLRARVETGRADLERLRSHLEAIDTAKGNGPVKPFLTARLNIW